MTAVAVSDTVCVRLTHTPPLNCAELVLVRLHASLYPTDKRQEGLRNSSPLTDNRHKHRRFSVLSVDCLQAIH